MSQEVHAKNEALVRAYQLCFSSPAGQEVLRDLVPFCRAATTYAKVDELIDPNKVLMLEGRRQVWLRIQLMMNLSPDDVMTISFGNSIQQGAKE